MERGGGQVGDVQPSGSPRRTDAPEIADDFLPAICLAATPLDVMARWCLAVRGASRSGPLPAH